MEINVMLDQGAFMPEKAHNTDAGFDIRTPKEFTVPGNTNAKNSATVDTGVRVEIPSGYVGFLKSKSGLNVIQHLTSEGVIDSGYTGSIRVKLYNHGPEDKVFKRGDKVTQLVFLPIPDISLKKTKSFKITDRGDGGFGSTGR